jgi:hypothetical protein
MQKSNGMSIFPVCPLAHSLLDKLTVIVGHCDLLTEARSTDSVSSQHLKLIRQAAQSMAVELEDHQCGASRATQAPRKWEWEALGDSGGIRKWKLRINPQPAPCEQLPTPVASPGSKLTRIS